ncbi:MAG TPA: hypothetical protein VFM35_12535 [Candidatus Binatia bacterium]|nr:hypothetical protein [Candidatus Binatia bacterium]
MPPATNPDGSTITGPSYEYIVNDNTNPAMRMQSALALSSSDLGQVRG